MATKKVAKKSTNRKKALVAKQPLRTGGYKPTPHIWFSQPRDLPPFSFATIRAMLIDPGVRLNLATRAAPLSGAQFAFKAKDESWVEGLQCTDPVIGAFIYRQLIHVWRNFLPALLRAQTWGWSAGEITYKLSRAGLVEIDKLEPRHAADCQLMKLKHKRWGVRIDRVEGQGAVALQFPYAWFHSYCAEDGEDYGISCLLGAYSPWADKWFNGGGLDVRRLFMHKDAYGGVDIGYPEGTTWVEGVNEPIPNADIARQITEQLISGGVTTRPSTRDENGNEKWPLTRATVTSNPSHILEYPKDLDDEIRRGMEIADDVISADGGGAWAGKRVTIASFYASLDHWVVQLVADLKEQVFDPLCMLNFGKVPEYEIRHKPLAEQAMEQQSNAGPGGEEPGGMPGMGMPGMDDGGGMPPDQGPQLAEMPPAPGQQDPFKMALGADKSKSDDKPADVDDYALTDERIDVMADLLASLYGDNAEAMLDHILDDGPKKLALWSPDDHPRGPDGRFIKKGTDEAFRLAKESVNAAHSTRSPESMKMLMGHMNTLTVKQLHQLKRDYGTKGSAATKAKLIEKLSSRLISGRHRLARKADDTPVAPVNEEVYSVPTSSLNVDPKRFQYKVKGISSDKGVGEELKGTSKWNPELGGVLLVWRDPETSKDYVVNGHHRHELASRTDTKQVNVRYIDAPDAKQARAKGALANIAEGRGTALDAAKYLRDSDRGIDHLRDAGISMSGKVAADAEQLTKLGDKSFQAVTNGLLEEDKAIAVAKWLPDHKLQDKLFKKLATREDDGKEWTLRQIEQAAKKMDRAGKITTQGTDLFGDFEDEESTFDQEVEIEDYISRQLTQEANDFGAVANTRRAERVSEAGNTLATDENQRRRDSARQQAATFDRESGLKGEIATAIKRHAALLAQAKNRKSRDAVKREAYEDLRELLTESPELPQPANDEPWNQAEESFGAIAMSVLKQYGDKPGEYSLSDAEAAEVEAGMRKLLKMSNGRPTEDTTGEPDAYDDMTWDGGNPREDLEKANAIVMGNLGRTWNDGSNDDPNTLHQLVAKLVRMARDAQGHEHKGKGPGGGQFTKQSGGGAGDAAEKPAHAKKADKNATKSGQNTAEKSAGGKNSSGSPASLQRDSVKDVPGTKIDSEETTAPPPGKAFSVNVEEAGEDGIAKSARVGVAGREVPPPPPIPKLPNLTRHEREVESRFRDAFLSNPNKLANDYRELVYKSDKPYTFETDQAKMLSDDWMDGDNEKQMNKRQMNNNALHQVANAIVKRAFLHHLDSLKPGDNVLVTVGGCGAGKGYTLKNTELGKGLTAQAKAVWDSAGDQNATENPWILEEAEKRGLKVTYAYVAGDPKVAWSDPGRGVVTRAHNPQDGRMVDAAVFADSYVMGAKNHHAFHQANKNNPNAKFLFFDAKDQSAIPGVPPDSLKWDRKSLYHWAMGSIQSRSDVAPSVLRGATQGARIWNEELAT